MHCLLSALSHFQDIFYIFPLFFISSFPSLCYLTSISLLFQQKKAYFLPNEHILETYPRRERIHDLSAKLYVYVAEITFVCIIVMTSTRANSEDYEDFTRKDRQSITSCNTNESDVEHLPSKSSLLPLRNDLRSDIFESGREVSELSAKLSQRAVSWMITLCWSKSLDQECVWATLLLFYCYKRQKQLRKDDIEITLLSCLFVAIKLTHNKTYTAKEIAAMSSKSLSVAQIVEKEADILEVVAFNAIIPHYLSEIYLCSSLSSEKLDEVMLVCELFAAKDFHIFFNKQKVEAIIHLVGSQDKGSDELAELRLEVKDLLVQKENKIILHKYASKFNTNLFVKRFT